MNKGPSNALRFRSTMDGVIYTSQNTFLLLKKKKKKKKTVEQDVNNVAIEHVSKRIEDKKFPIVYEVCYSITVNL